MFFQKPIAFSIFMCYNKYIIKTKNKYKEDEYMIITVNNTTMTKELAIKNAVEINDETGTAVFVCDSLGDVIAWVNKQGKLTEF